MASDTPTLVSINGCRLFYVALNQLREDALVALGNEYHVAGARDRHGADGGILGCANPGALPTAEISRKISDVDLPCTLAKMTMRTQGELGLGRAIASAPASLRQCRPRPSLFRDARTRYVTDRSSVG